MHVVLPGLWGEHQSIRQVLVCRGIATTGAGGSGGGWLVSCIYISSRVRGLAEGGRVVASRVLQF